MPPVPKPEPRIGQKSHRASGRRFRPTEKYRASYETGCAYVLSLSEERRSKPTPDDLRYLYEELKLSQNHIGSVFNCSEATIRNWMRSAALESRSNFETKTSHYNAMFFKEWSPAMAWVLGYIYTDGNINRGRVEIASMDRELLEKVRALITQHLSIKSARQSYDRNRRINRLRIQHKEMVDDLHKLGLEEEKSLVMVFPDVPENCMRHFIRGCWDGDGGFSDDGNRRLSAHYTCGSEKFIKRIAVELFSAGIVRINLRSNSRETDNDVKALIATYGRDGPFPPTIYKRKTGNAFDLRIGLPESLDRLFDYFYKDVDPAIYLVRKYEKVKQFLERRRVMDASVGQESFDY